MNALVRPRVAPPRLLACALAFAGASCGLAQPLAFPGAEGFGRHASGGRGGDVYIVTNLNDSGPGSLRAGVTGRGVSSPPRTVVFAVSGTIYLQSTLRINVGNLTIAGQTAPGDGICLAYRPLDISGSTNVIVRFLRVRLGDVAGVETDAFTSRYGSNIIVDHCSFSWSVDETSSTYDNTDLTLQWCFITESLRDSVHSKGAHGYGGIWGGKSATYHHNLVAHHDSRNPRFNGARTHGTADELVDMRNNVIYNWRGNSTYGGEPTDAGLPARHNMVANTYKRGPATGTAAKSYRILEPTRNSAAPAGADYSLFYVAGNWTTGSSAVTANNWNGGVQVIASSLYPSIRSDTPFAAPAVLTQTAQTSYALVLDHAGCRLPARDTVDARIAAEVAAGAATHAGSKGAIPGIIDSQADVGGWPALASAPAPADADLDGMPDAWELARGLDPADPADRNHVPYPENGYTNLENYLNELAAPAFPYPQFPAPPPASVAVASGSPLVLSAPVSGAAPLAYQWFKDDQPVPGATAAVLSVPAAAASHAGAYRVTATNAHAAAASPLVVVAVVEPDAYAAFLAAHGLSSAPGGSGAPDADPDGDGVPNAFEFLLGGHPLSSASAPAPSLGLSPSAPASAEFVFARRRDHADRFDLVVESSSDLAAWEPVFSPGGEATLAVSPLDETMERVAVRVPISEARIFLRLRATAR